MMSNENDPRAINLNPKIVGGFILGLVGLVSFGGAFWAKAIWDKLESQDETLVAIRVEMVRMRTEMKHNLEETKDHSRRLSRLHDKINEHLDGHVENGSSKD